MSKAYKLYKDSKYVPLEVLEKMTNQERKSLSKYVYVPDYMFDDGATGEFLEYVIDEEGNIRF